jgi:hypothetical protein
MSVLESARVEREQIKLEISEVIGLQRECEEGSKLYLELERRFMRLLEAEDETILKISRLVNEMIIASKLSKDATRVCKSYFNEG